MAEKHVQHTSNRQSSRYAWCETHKAFTPRECAGPDCELKETDVVPIEEGGA